MFRGKILGGFDREQVKANLVRLFRSDGERIEALLAAPKTVLKSGLGRAMRLRATRKRCVRRAFAVIGEGPIVADIPAPVASVPPPASPQVEPPPVPEPPSGLTLAEVGAQLLPPQSRPHAEFDTSAWSLAACFGAVLADHCPQPKPEFDLAGLDLAPPGDPIDLTPRPAPLTIDTSALSVVEVPVQAEKPPSELHKLLTSHVDRPAIRRRRGRRRPWGSEYSVTTTFG